MTPLAALPVEAVDAALAADNRVPASGPWRRRPTLDRHQRRLVDLAGRFVAFARAIGRERSWRRCGRSGTAWTPAGPKSWA